jgi:hypothetical protein
VRQDERKNYLGRDWFGLSVSFRAGGRDWLVGRTVGTLGSCGLSGVVGPGRVKFGA